jgi:hypothetical protein
MIFSVGAEFVRERQTLVITVPDIYSILTVEAGAFCFS